MTETAQKTVRIVKSDQSAQIATTLDKESAPQPTSTIWVQLARHPLKTWTGLQYSGPRLQQLIGQRVHMTDKRILVTVALASALLVTSCSDASEIDLAGVFAEKEWELATNPRDATALACAGEPRCEQAYETDQALYLKFDSTKDAEAAMASYGGAAQRSRVIVVNFKDPSLSKEQRQQIFEVVEGTHQS